MNRLVCILSNIIHIPLYAIMVGPSIYEETPTMTSRPDQPVCCKPGGATSVRIYMAMLENKFKVKSNRIVDIRWPTSSNLNKDNKHHQT